MSMWMMKMTVREMNTVRGMNRIKFDKNRRPLQGTAMTPGNQDLDVLPPFTVLSCQQTEMALRPSYSPRFGLCKLDRASPNILERPTPSPQAPPNRSDQHKRPKKKKPELVIVR
jgi:hypothetical protein